MQWLNKNGTKNNYESNFHQDKSGFQADVLRDKEFSTAYELYFGARLKELFRQLWSDTPITIYEKLEK